MNDKVSIIMGVFNGENRVGNAIESILNQDYDNFELIICDDCSTDNTLNILKKYEMQDKRIKVIQNDKNKQLAYTLNHCLEYVTGDFVARMDDDDFSHSNRLRKEIEFLKNNPKYALVGAGRNMVDSTGIWAKENGMGEVSKLDVLKGRTFVHPTVMIRTNILRKLNGYVDSKKCFRVEDLDLWMRLYNAGYIGYNLEDILLDYFEDPNSMKRRKYRYRINEFQLKRKYYKNLKISFKYMVYVYKPLIVGIIPKLMLNKIKKGKKKI